VWGREGECGERKDVCVCFLGGVSDGEGVVREGGQVCISGEEERREVCACVRKCNTHNMRVR
jgi:hypothetical protein